MSSKTTVKAAENTETKPLFRKCFSPGETWSKDEFLDGLYWMRQGCSLVAGIGVGLAGFTGFAVITTFITLNFLLSLMYFRSVLVSFFVTPQNITNALEHRSRQFTRGLSREL
ncbi:hypothetical protein NDN08_008072 [Rhodosorus marinus]|uniref:ER membrane protein complex subunit 6 n=1 Tax=Rhodosorus marinus TaxID=101924 RepID=A0AAV8UZD0_9RHOD|nr:hypothetical protein NDN08_008072 [Rhodosorus marinus]